MEHNEAKAILELHRPGNTDDRDDPLIAEALQQLDTDAELRDWFDAQQVVDARIADSLSAIEPPADLKAHILAGMRAHGLRHESQREGESEKVTILSGADDEMEEPTTSQAWWRNPWVGIAAVFAFLFVLSIIPKGGNERSGIASNQSAPQQAGIPGMIDFLAAHIAELPDKTFDKRSDQPGDLKAYLAKAGAPNPSHLPAPMGEKATIGCFTLDYNGARMGIICFKDDQIVHLTTVMKKDCTGEFPTHPTTYETQGQAFRVWTEGEEVYILSTAGSKENLPEWI
jgi:hypothetical protein